MSRSKKVFAVHRGEILKTKFNGAPGVGAYALANALGFPGIHDVVRGDRAISADTAVRLGSISACTGAILAQSSERPRPETCRGQRNRQKEQTPEGGL